MYMHVCMYLIVHTVLHVHVHMYIYTCSLRRANNHRGEGGSVRGKVSCMDELAIAKQYTHVHTRVFAVHTCMSIVADSPR